MSCSFIFVLCLSGRRRCDNKHVMLSYDVGVNRTIRFNIRTQWNVVKATSISMHGKKELYQLLMSA